MQCRSHKGTVGPVSPIEAQANQDHQVPWGLSFEHYVVCFPMPHLISLLICLYNFAVTNFCWLFGNLRIVPKVCGICSRSFVIFPLCPIFSSPSSLQSFSLEFVRTRHTLEEWISCLMILHVRRIRKRRYLDMR